MSGQSMQENHTEYEPGSIPFPIFSVFQQLKESVKKLS